MQNLSVNNLTVLGQITFSDNTSQNTSYASNVQNTSGIQRDILNNVTSFNIDDVVVEKNLAINQSLDTASMRTSMIQFMNDLDPNGVPVFQSKGFSNQLRDNLISAKTKIDSIIPDIIEPPLKKAKLNLAEFVSPLLGTTSIQPNEIQLSNSSSKIASFKVNPINHKLDITTTDNVINMSNSSLENVTNVIAPTAANLTIDGNDNSIIFKTGNEDRVTINNIGVMNFETGNIDTVNGIFTGTFDGTASYSITAQEVECKSDDTNGSYYVPFTKNPGTNSKLLFIDDVSGPLTYNPSTSTLTATNFSGKASSANQLNCEVTNSSGSFYVTFVSTAGAGNKSFFIDDESGFSPLSYQPLFNNLNCTATNANNINCTSDNSTGTFLLPFVKSTGTGFKQLFIDDSTTALTYNPSTNIIGATCTVSQLTAAAVIVQTSSNSSFNVLFGGLTGNSNIRSHTTLLFNPGTNTLTSNIVTATETVNAPLVQNLNGNLTLGCNSTGAGGKIAFSGGTGLLSGTSGGNSGQHLAVTINGIDYKIALQLP